MKQLTRFFFVALLLLAAGLGAGDAEAQRYYARMTNGRPITSTESKALCDNPVLPCDLAGLLTVTDLANGDQIAILESKANDVVEIKSSVSISDSLNFAFYNNANTQPTLNHPGTLIFSGTNLTIGDGGVIQRLGNVKLIIKSRNVSIDAVGTKTYQSGDSYTYPAIPGTVEISGSLVKITQSDETDCMKFDRLVISGDTRITPKGSKDCLDSDVDDAVVIKNSLKVDARLEMLGAAGSDIPTIYVGASATGIEVNGAIESFRGKLRLGVSGFSEPEVNKAGSLVALYNAKTCFEVDGTGSIEMDLEVITPQYICVKVPSIGAGGTSTIYAGTVEIESAMVDGNLLNRGAARTDIKKGLTLTGNLEIDGRWVTPSLGYQGNPIVSQSTDGVLTIKDYYDPKTTPNDLTDDTGISVELLTTDNFLDIPIVAIDTLDWTGARSVISRCLPARRPGVHLGQGAMIDGDVTMTNIAKQNKPGFQSALDEITGDPPNNRSARPASGLYAVVCQSGLFLEGNGVTTIEGMFKAQELHPTGLAQTFTAVNTLGGYAHLGANHNLVLEGDLDISGTLTAIEMADPAGLGKINACSKGGASTSADGNKLILSGPNFQEVKFSTDVDPDGTPRNADDIDRTLMLDALTIDKSGGEVEFYQGLAGVLVKYLEPLNGTLSTGSAVSNSSLLGFEPGGAIAFTGGEGNVAYPGTGGTYIKDKGPSLVVYASGSHEIGAERGGAGDVTILSDGVITIKGKGGKITNLNLYTGTLKVMDELEVSGAITMGNTGKFDLTAGSLKHSGNNLTYAGNMARSAGMALMADSVVASKFTDMRTITVNQACPGSVGLEVDLNAGYTSTSGNLMVTKGALDLNGGGLVLQDHQGDKGTPAQTVQIGEHGMICDSGNGVACSGSSALEDDVKRGDELFAALEGIREDNSEKTQAALDKSVDAYSTTVAKTDSTHGMGIMIGYVEKDHAPVTNISTAKKDKMLPMIKAMGGAVNLSSDGKKISVAGLSIDGGKTSVVTVASTVGRLSVSGDLSVASGKLSLATAETALAMGHMQTGGDVEAGNGKYTVMGAFSVTGGKYTQGATGKLSLAGDVTVSSKSTFAGSTTLIGTKTAQMVSASQDLGDVIVNAGGGVMLSGDVAQGASNDLTLQRGHISTGDHEWMIKNKGIEHDLAVRTAVPTNAEGTDPATIFLGNRASFVDGSVSRKVAHGNSGSMGSVKGGYLFPVGMVSETRDRYRPLILNFATDVSPEEVTVTTTSYSGEVTWPSAGITTASTAGGTYMLDTYAPIMWKVEFSGIPALGATLRVAADGLVGVNDSNGLRLVQWDCDGTNVRLAGEFDLSASGVDASSVSANGRINGVPNTTMDGVDAAECSIVGIAANYAENPIGTAPPAATPMANVQLIHNIVGATVDVYVDDVLVADNFAFQTATSLATQIAAGQHMVHVTPATAPDNSTPIASIPVVLAANGMYTVVANGDLTNFNFAMLSNTRAESVADDKVEFRIVHGAASLGEVDLRSLAETGRWANNLGFNEATGYRTADAVVHNVELLDGHTQVDVFELDLGDYINQTLVLALSGTGVSSAQGLTLMGVATDGSVFFPQVVTSAHAEELPTEFALQGNYPNPFNPSTQIQFDLPSTADVEIQVIDLLGRMVLSLPSQSVEAGANRTVELDGSSLASGTYLYRLIAKMESGVQVETGRMVLIK